MKDYNFEQFKSLKEIPDDLMDEFLADWDDFLNTALSILDAAFNEYSSNEIM